MIARTVLQDWQAGRMRWPDAVAALGLAGLPALYAAAYRHGVPIVRRFADELALPDLARRGDLTPALWRANAAWQPVWQRHFEWLHRVHGIGGIGHALQRADGLERGVGWLVREQYYVRWTEADVEQMAKDAEADRARMRRIRHRVTWLELAFDPMPDDPCRTVVAMWSSAETSTKVACEILGVDLGGLVRLAAELGLPLRPGVSMTVAPAGLPDGVFERLQRLADEYTGDDELAETAIRIDCGVETIDQALDRLGATTPEERRTLTAQIMAAAEHVADEIVAEARRRARAED